MEIKRLGKTYNLENLEDLKKLLDSDLKFIAISDKRRKLTKNIIQEARFLELKIFKMEEPEKFENHRQALKDYCNHKIKFEN